MSANQSQAGPETGLKIKHIKMVVETVWETINGRVTEMIRDIASSLVATAETRIMGKVVEMIAAQATATPASVVPAPTPPPPAQPAETKEEDIAGALAASAAGIGILGSREEVPVIETAPAVVDVRPAPQVVSAAGGVNDDFLTSLLLSEKAVSAQKDQAETQAYRDLTATLKERRLTLLDNVLVEETVGKDERPWRGKPMRYLVLQIAGGMLDVEQAIALAQERDWTDPSYGLLMGAIADAELYVMPGEITLPEPDGRTISRIRFLLEQVRAGKDPAEIAKFAEAAGWTRVNTHREHTETPDQSIGAQLLAKNGAQ